MIEFLRSDMGEGIRIAVPMLAAIVLLSFVAVPMIVKSFPRKHGIFLAVIGMCFLWSMATKPPSPEVTWDSGIHNDGSSFDTNTWATVHFKWRKDPIVVGTEPLYFATKARDAGADVMPIEIGESTCGALTWDYTFTGGENATNYLYYAFTRGAVHTNGVWTGNILIKQLPGTGGVDKMVIIRGKMYRNGIEIAPKIGVTP